MVDPEKFALLRFEREAKKLAKVLEYLQRETAFSDSDFAFLMQLDESVFLTIKQCDYDPGEPLPFDTDNLSRCVELVVKLLMRREQR